MSGSARILVIANRTCPCKELHDELVARAEGRESEVLVVAPALNSRLNHWTSDTDGAVEAAQDRLGAAVESLEERGLGAHGQVGDADPLVAIDDALADFAADEIVVSTHPEGRSNWLEKELPEKARERFGLPVTHLVSEYGLDPAEKA